MRRTPAPRPRRASSSRGASRTRPRARSAGRPSPRTRGTSVRSRRRRARARASGRSGRGPPAGCPSPSGVRPRTPRRETPRPPRRRPPRAPPPPTPSRGTSPGSRCGSTGSSAALGAGSGGSARTSRNRRRTPSRRDGRTSFPCRARCRSRRTSTRASWACLPHAQLPRLASGLAEHEHVAELDGALHVPRDDPPLVAPVEDADLDLHGLAGHARATDDLHDLGGNPPLVTPGPSLLQRADLRHELVHHRLPLARVEDRAGCGRLPEPRRDAELLLARHVRVRHRPVLAQEGHVREDLLGLHVLRHHDELGLAPLHELRDLVRPLSELPAVAGDLDELVRLVDEILRRLKSHLYFLFPLFFTS